MEYHSRVHNEVVSSTDPVSVRVEDRVKASTLNHVVTACHSVVLSVDELIAAT